jgi:hypothetical protein
MKYQSELNRRLGEINQDESSLQGSIQADRSVPPLSFQQQKPALAKSAVVWKRFLIRTLRQKPYQN